MDFLENLQNILNEEKLYEMASVTKSGVPSIKLQVDRGRNYKDIEYFKVYDNDSYSKATKSARISFREPIYISHKNPDGKQAWILNSKDKRGLIRQLTQPSRLFKSGDFLIWHDCIAYFNNEAYGVDFEDSLNILIKDNPKYLPIDLPMPDYTKL